MNVEMNPSQHSPVVGILWCLVHSINNKYVYYLLQSYYVNAKYYKHAQLYARIKLCY